MENFKNIKKKNSFLGELSKLPSRMGYVKKSEVMGILGCQKTKECVIQKN